LAPRRQTKGIAARHTHLRAGVGGREECCPLGDAPWRTALLPRLRLATPPRKEACLSTDARQVGSRVAHRRGFCLRTPAGYFCLVRCCAGRKTARVVVEVSIPARFVGSGSVLNRLCRPAIVKPYPIPLPDYPGTVLDRAKKLAGHHHQIDRA
jgi:hypothetical protein